MRVCRWLNQSYLWLERSPAHYYLLFKPPNHELWFDVIMSQEVIPVKSNSIKDTPTLHACGNKHHNHTLTITQTQISACCDYYPCPGCVQSNPHVKSVTRYALVVISVNKSNQSHRNKPNIMHMTEWRVICWWRWWDRRESEETIDWISPKVMLCWAKESRGLDQTPWPAVVTI